MQHFYFHFLPPAARNLFEKRFLDFQKLFIKSFIGSQFLEMFCLSQYN